MLAVCALAVAPAAWAANPRPDTVPALREWTGGKGQFKLGEDARVFAPKRFASEGRLLARDLKIDFARHATPGAGDVVLERGLRRAPHRGLLADDRAEGDRDGAEQSRRVLRRAHAPAAPRRRPHGSARPRARQAALPRARPDDRQRPPVLLARVADGADPRARGPQAQPAPPALLRQPGLPARERVAPRDRHEPALDEGRRRASCVRRRPPPPRDDRARARHARAPAGGARAAPRAAAHERGRADARPTSST